MLCFTELCLLRWLTFVLFMTIITITIQSQYAHKQVVNLQGVQISSYQMIICFPYISAQEHQIIQILVSTPIMRGVIMGGGHILMIQCSWAEIWYKWNKKISVNMLGLSCAKLSWSLASQLGYSRLVTSWLLYSK